MKYLKIGIITISLLLLVASASAWQFSYQDHTGTIQFYNDGDGMISSGNYVIPFTWEQTGQDTYDATPVFPYSLMVQCPVQFVYVEGSDTIALPAYPDVTIYN
jgi:hypothetical protein